MVCLVVDDDDAPLRAQLPADAPHDLVRGLGERAGFLRAQQRLGQPCSVAAFMREKGVIVGDDDLRSLEPLEQLAGEEVPFAVVVRRVIGQEDAQAVADRDAGTDEEKGVAETRILRIGQLVERLPGDEHPHDDRLAGAGGHLEGDAKQVGVASGGVGLAQRVGDPRVAVLARHLGDVDRRLHRLDLAEEQLPFALGVGPVREQSRRRRGNTGVAPLPPERHLLADAVDQLIGPQPVLRPFRFERELRRLPASLGNGDEVARLPPAVEDFPRDSTHTKLEVASRLDERRVDDWILDDYICHIGTIWRATTASGRAWNLPRMASAETEDAREVGSSSQTYVHY